MVTTSNVVISKDGVQVTVGTTRITENGNKALTLISVPKSTSDQDINEGANDIQIVDLLLKPERRYSIDGQLCTGLNGLNTYLTSDASIGAATINVVSTAGFASTGTVTINANTVTYTGKSATTFTGCAGITVKAFAGASVTSSTDTNSDAADKRDDLRKIFFAGGVFSVVIEGTTYNANADKYEFRWVANDESPVTTYDLKMTFIVGVDI